MYLSCSMIENVFNQHAQCFKTQIGDRPSQDTESLVEPMSHWSDRMTIDPVYIKIFMAKNYIINEILIKKNLVIFFLFKVRTLKKLYSPLKVCRLIS